jgi:hypothetical protein
VGCGSGILALARGSARAVGPRVDVEEGAVREARRHAERNHLAATFACAPLDAVTGRWDLVVANLHAELLVASAAALGPTHGPTLAVRRDPRGSVSGRSTSRWRPTLRVHREAEDGWVAAWWTR